MPSNTPQQLNMQTATSTNVSSQYSRPLKGAGLGLRRELLPQMAKMGLDKIDVGQASPTIDATLVSESIDFFEISPENWLNADGQIGGGYARQLRAYTERYAFVCHGLSLSIGSTAALDIELLHNIKRLIQTHGISLYTEHLSWCQDASGHLYDLLPIPCTQEAVYWVADRIKRAQDILGQQIGFENASYYYMPPHSDMSDAEFITAVAEEADCLLHLDVNNIYVNSQNFGFDAHAYLRELPLARTCYVHVAGHYVDDDGLVIDTHGNNVIDPVWQLLSDAYALIEQQTGKPASELPTCLERDFNFPALSELVTEVQSIRSLQYASSLSEPMAMGQRNVV